MKAKPNTEQIQSFMRSVLKVAGGYFAAKGLASGSDVESIVAGGVALAGFIWSHYTHSNGNGNGEPVAKSGDVK